MKNRAEIPGRDAFNPNVPGPPLILERRTDEQESYIMFQTFVPQGGRIENPRPRVLLNVREADLQRALAELGWKVERTVQQ